MGVKCYSLEYFIQPMERFIQHPIPSPFQAPLGHETELPPVSARILDAEVVALFGVRDPPEESEPLKRYEQGCNVASLSLRVARFEIIFLKIVKHKNLARISIWQL